MNGKLPMSVLRAGLLLLGLVLLSSTAFGYTLFLKDGSQVICQGKYRVEGDRALVVLESGQTTSFRLSDIDVERTDHFNKSNLGSAVVIDGGPVKPVRANSDSPADRDLQDLIRERRARGTTAQARPPSRRQQQPVRKTRAGYLDLASVQRRALNDRDTSEALDLTLRKAGVGAFKIFQGTEDGAVFLEITADSRDAVFQAIQATATALADLGPLYGVERIQLLMQTSSRGRAGQFMLAPEDAAELSSGSVTVERYFLENVQF